MHQMTTEQSTSLSEMTGISRPQWLSQQ